MTDKKVKSGHIDPEITMLLHDHAQASEDARYRDSLLLHGFYFSLAVLAGLAAAIVRIPFNYTLAAIVSFVSTIMFLIFTISLTNLAASRDSAWNRRAAIEKETVLQKKVLINKWIVEGYVENCKQRDKSWCEKTNVACWIKGFEISATVTWGVVFICSVCHLQICT